MPSFMHVVSVTQLYNASLNKWKVPEERKFVIEILIHNGMNIHRPENYTPVCPTPVVFKSPWKTVKKCICKHLNNHSAILSAQHGFIVWMSCSTKLLHQRDPIPQRLEGDHPSGVWCMDFDSVKEDHLCHQMKAPGKTGASTWLNSFLKERKFSIRVWETRLPLPKWQLVPGPTIFFPLINETTKCMCSLCCLFFDDIGVPGVDLKGNIEAVKAWSHK